MLWQVLFLSILDVSHASQDSWEQHTFREDSALISQPSKDWMFLVDSGMVDTYLTVLETEIWGSRVKLIWVREGVLFVHSRCLIRTDGSYLGMIWLIILCFWDGLEICLPILNFGLFLSYWYIVGWAAAGEQIVNILLCSELTTFYGYSQSISYLKYSVLVLNRLCFIWLWPTGDECKCLKLGYTMLLNRLIISYWECIFRDVMPF